jgi:four helix bundle protein
VETGGPVGKEKSYRFALRIIKLSRWLRNNHKEFELSRQLLRSGTAVGALIHEAEFAQSRADFINKLQVALKEANETKYWLMLLRDSGYLSDKMYDSIQPDIDELLKLLVTSVKSLRDKR